MYDVTSGLRLLSTYYSGIGQPFKGHPIRVILSYIEMHDIKGDYDFTHLKGVSGKTQYEYNSLVKGEITDKLKLAIEMLGEPKQVKTYQVKLSDNLSKKYCNRYLPCVYGEWGYIYSEVEYQLRIIDKGEVLPNKFYPVRKRVSEFLREEGYTVL